MNTAISIFTSEYDSAAWLSDAGFTDRFFQEIP